MNAPFKPEARTRSLNDLALEAVAAEVILRGWQSWDGEEDYAARDDAALAAREAFIKALLEQTGISRPLWDTLKRENIL